METSLGGNPFHIWYNVVALGFQSLDGRLYDMVVV
jgi:hypothetical protein